MRRWCGWLWVPLLVATVLQGEESVFEMPRLHGRHAMLQQQLIQAVRARQIEEMESIARQGVKLMPKDPTWQYNLACALAYRADKSEALVELERAIELGFRDVKGMREDDDLKQLAGLPRFQELLKRAEELQEQPVAGRAEVAPSLVFMGRTAEINASNTVWNFETGCFNTFFNLRRGELRKLATYAEDYRGPAPELLKQWFTANEAAGNFGDLYMNRDKGHSDLIVTNFPGMTRVTYSAAAQEHKVDVSMPNVAVDYPLLGNCSMAITEGAFWRSLPRSVLTDPMQLMLATRFYLGNQIWFYPAHRDYTTQGGDLFPANAPYFIVSVGSSYSDKPFMEACAAALAAMQPQVKQQLVARKWLAPTLQMLLRQAQLGVTNEAAYLSGRAHPVTFAPADLEVERMVRLAHELQVADVPPPVMLRTVKDFKAEQGVDYFDLRSETLFDTPFCIARVGRAMHKKRSITLEAHAAGRAAQEYRWVLLLGDEEKVKIKPLEGSAARVEIEVEYHGTYRPTEGERGVQVSRVDVGCFVKGGANWSAPSIYSLYWLADEERVYREDGQILSVDYSNATHRYADPVLSMQKGWKDLYEYADDGELLGWYRMRGGTTGERFTWRGHKVLESDAQNRPIKACEVEYLPRQSGITGMPPSLTYADKPKVFVYAYKDAKDKRGEIRR